MAVTTRTIQVALGGMAVCIISIFLPWLTASGWGIKVSLSMVEAFEDSPKWFEGLPAILAVGILWMVILYLLRFPKLALIGILPLAFVWLGMYVTADEYGFNLGFGSYIYIIALVVCIVASFMTPKIPKNPNYPNFPNYPTGGGNPPVPPGTWQ